MICSCCRKRTKKTTVKAGRKKANTGDIPIPREATPRTRAAAAREAAVRARLKAELAEEKVRAAMEAVEQASMAAIRLLPSEPVALEAPPSPSTRRFVVLSHFVSCTSLEKNSHAN
jgi:hypothetical protein